MSKEKPIVKDLRFVQAFCSDTELYGLDKDGKIWQLDQDNFKWYMVTDEVGTME